MKRNRFPFEGERLTLSIIAKRTGMNPGTLYCRVVYQGMSIQDAVSRPITPCRVKNPAGKPAKRHLFRGEMLTVTEVANRTGIKAQTLRYRMTQHGALLDDAITPPIRTKKPITRKPAAMVRPVVETIPCERFPAASAMLIAERRQRLRNHHLIRRMADAFQQTARHDHDG